jgi:hypothetical protein
MIMEIKPHKIKTISGRETRWYGLPPGRRMKQGSANIRGPQAKVERWTETHWIFSMSNRWDGDKVKSFTSLESCEDFWRTWLERRTENLW